MALPTALETARIESNRAPSDAGANVTSCSPSLEAKLENASEQLETRKALRHLRQCHSILPPFCSPAFWITPVPQYGPVALTFHCAHCNLLLRIFPLHSATTLDILDGAPWHTTACYSPSRLATMPYIGALNDLRGTICVTRLEQLIESAVYCDAFTD